MWTKINNSLAIWAKIWANHFKLSEQSGNFTYKIKLKKSWEAKKNYIIEFQKNY